MNGAKVCHVLTKPAGGGLSLGECAPKQRVVVTVVGAPAQRRGSSRQRFWFAGRQQLPAQYREAWAAHFLAFLARLCLATVHGQQCCAEDPERIEFHFGLLRGPPFCIIAMKQSP